MPEPSRLAAPCPVCARKQGVSIDVPQRVPVLMNRTYSSAEEARAAPRATLALARCTHCGFVWNAAFDPSAIRYDAAYENDQTHSTAFVAHLAARATDVVQAVAPPAPLRILEVGCGQGRFLAELDDMADSRPHSLEGFDPAWRGPDETGPGGSRIHRCYFDAGTAARLRQPPNVVVTRHTIEHVPDPVGFLSAIRAALGADSRAALFVETPCVDWIFAREALQDFCYEHCSLFSAGSLALAMRRAGFEPMQVDHVFGEQYLWASGRAAAPAPQTIGPRPVVSVPDIDGMRQLFLQRWRQELRLAARQGPVALWGASTKGVTFALLNDPEAGVIDHVVDINPAKQGRFIAPTGLPIVSPQDSAMRAPRTIFLMNPNYETEVVQLLDTLQVSARLVPIN
jgi:SAM-dependent methyltransferase